MRAETMRDSTISGQVDEMESSLTAEDVRLLSQWAADTTDGSDSEWQPLPEVPDDDLALQEAPEAPRRTRKKRRATYLRTKVGFPLRLFMAKWKKLPCGHVGNLTRRKCSLDALQEAKEGLQDEIAALESRLAVLKQRAGIGGEQSSVEQTAVQNAVLRGVAQQQHMVMAGAHSVLVKRLVSWSDLVQTKELNVDDPCMMNCRTSRQRTRCIRRCTLAKIGSHDARH